MNDEVFLERKKTKKVRVGDIFIGGDSPVTVQSMTNTDTRDIKATIDQIKRLQEAGCDIVRLAIPDREAAIALGEIKKASSIPVVADIHFDYRLAILSIENGADKIRINPGNIGGMDRVKAVVDAAKSRDIPIRIGVNSGSIEKNIREKYGKVTPEGMVESALLHSSMLEEFGFENIVFSLKASNVPMAIKAYRLMSEKSNYPLHIGITEAGTLKRGTIKSCVGLGCLLGEGIGDTIRVSLTHDPVEEVIVGNEVLNALGIGRGGVEFISCPTCGRCGIDLIRIADKVERELGGIKRNIKVAVMGCEVNGPGEAKDADIGIAGGKGGAVLFKKGEIIRRISEDSIVEELLNEIKDLE